MFPCLEGQKIVNGTFREFSQLLQWLPLLLMSLSYAPVSSKGQELWCLMEDYQQTSQSAFTADLFGAAQTSSGAFFLLGLAYLGEVKLLIEQPRKVVLSKFPSKLCCGFVCGEKKKQTNHRLFLFFCFFDFFFSVIANMGHSIFSKATMLSDVFHLLFSCGKGGHVLCNHQGSMFMSERIFFDT